MPPYNQGENDRRNPDYIFNDIPIISSSLENGLTILLLSHDLDYSYWLRGVVNNNFPEAHLRFTRTEHEATQYLDGVGIYDNRFCYPMPDVLLVDMDHPHGDHLALVTLLGSDVYTSMPLVLLSSNPDLSEVKRCLDRGANSFVTEREGEEGLKDVLDSIQQMKALWKSHQVQV